MKFLRSVFYLTVVELMLLSACGPGTPTSTPTPTGLANPNALPISNAPGGVVPPVLAPPPCSPPVPTIGEVTAFCADPVKGVGGASFSDMTNLNGAGAPGSLLVGDSIPGTVSCNLDEGTSLATCSGPQNGTFQAMICASCGGYGNQTTASAVCANGYGKNGLGECVSGDTKHDSPSAWCPAGSHYDNDLQNCADNATGKLASPCPPGYSTYEPNAHKCWDKAEEAFNCQTFSVQLGTCLVPKPANVQLTIIPFCQNKHANQGAANLTFPAGSSLSVDTKSNHLNACAPGGTQPDGTQLLTCLGTGGKTFDAQFCTDAKDPSSCTTYHETLGICTGDGAPGGSKPGGSKPAATACIPSTSSAATCP